MRESEGQGNGRQGNDQRLDSFAVHSPANSPATDSDFIIRFSVIAA
jgi:hypothetical protein